MGRGTGEWSGRGGGNAGRGVGPPGETRDTWRTWIGMGRWRRVRAPLESMPTNRSGWERERERVEQLHDPFTAVGSKSKRPTPTPTPTPQASRAGQVGDGGSCTPAYSARARPQFVCFFRYFFNCLAPARCSSPSLSPRKSARAIVALQSLMILSGPGCFPEDRTMCGFTKI